MNKKQAEKNKLPRTIEDNLYLCGLFLINVSIIYLISVSFWPRVRNVIRFPPCFFHLLTGYYCPGCGGTRAVRALLHGHIIQSFLYHPFVPYSSAVYLYFMTTQSIQRLSRGKLQIGMHYHNAYLWTAVIILIGNFIIRNFLHHFYGFNM